MYTSPVEARQGQNKQKTAHIRAVAQSGSALAWGARGRGFESRLPDSKRGSVEKLSPFFIFSFAAKSRVKS